MLLTILFFTFLATIVSLLLVSTLLFFKKFVDKFSFHFVAFAAGALLATGFTDTLPEAVEKNSQSFIIITFCIALFFLLEKILHVHHHEEEIEKQKIKLPLSLLLIGNGLHNFIDGVALASTFLVSYQLGIVTALAVFIHEIPHEIGDFGLLLHMGYRRQKALWLNIASGFIAILGAIVGYFLSIHIENILPILLSITTANFIYLAMSDLIPEIHHKSKGSFEFFHVLAFFLGVGFIVVLGLLFKT